MRAAIRKLGNSSGVIIPKSMLTEIGVVAGDTVDLSLEDGRITIAPIKRRPREGWADAFDQVEELGDEDRAWLEFGNQGEDELTW
ncbi:MAG: AbrB/MazE/SpoVT family DNA-binding domain-containing protein [Alphaproteobacteria bacterium]|nr:MAG: AbrB/MazE/SpoVT family DNA-binding domain-containing protein [Alphaproteobacteria bacterium]